MLTRDMMHSYQNYLVEQGKARPKCGLFIPMGMGKTVASLTLVSDLVEEFEVTHVLIIAPLRVAMSTWPSEIVAWEHTKHLDFAVACGDAKTREQAVRRKATITIINRENIAWLVKYLRGQKIRWPYDMVIVDESSSFKNQGSQRFRALRSVLKRIDRMVLLTGTPTSNGLLDLWPQVYLLDQGQRLGKGVTGFRNTYFDSDYMGYNWAPREGAEEKIHEKIRDICFSLSAQDYLQLPGRIENQIEVDMPTDAWNQYADLARDFLLQLESMEEDSPVVAQTAAVLTNKLLQFANGALYDEDKNWHEVHTAKLDALESIIEEAAGEPVLVAYNYKSDLARIQKRFKHAIALDKDPATIDRWNRREIPLLLAHPASAGHGLNLQKGGRTIAWFGLNWSLELDQQFNARLDRQGQKDTVFIHRIVTSGTVDLDVLAALEGKHQTQKALLDAVKARIKEDVKPCRK